MADCNRESHSQKKGEARVKVLPDEITNEFRGHRCSALAFLIIALVSLARSLAHIFLPDGGAGSIATIDLGVEGAGTIVSMFALWGLSQLLMSVFYVIVYFRYKSLIPLMYIFVIAEYAGRIAIGQFKPVETVGVAPGAVGNFLILPLAIVLFLFSMGEGNAPATSTRPIQTGQ